MKIASSKKTIFATKINTKNSPSNSTNRKRMEEYSIKLSELNVPPRIFYPARSTFRSE